MPRHWQNRSTTQWTRWTLEAASQDHSFQSLRMALSMARGRITWLTRGTPCLGEVTTYRWFVSDKIFKLQCTSRPSRVTESFFNWSLPFSSDCKLPLRRVCQPSSRQKRAGHAFIYGSSSLLKKSMKFRTGGRGLSDGFWVIDLSRQPWQNTVCGRHITQLQIANGSDPASTECQSRPLIFAGVIAPSVNWQHSTVPAQHG